MTTLRVATAAVSLTDENMAALGRTEPCFQKGHEGQLRAVCLAFEAGGERLCLVACDTLVLPDDVVERTAPRIVKATGLKFDNLLLAGTHTHSAPWTFAMADLTGRDNEFCARLEEGMVLAATEACRKLDEAAPGELDAELLFSQGQEITVGRNSRLLLRDGSIGWHGYQAEDVVRPTGPHDPDIPVLAFRRPDGTFAALLFGVSVHNIGALDPALYSPAFLGLSAQELERRHNATTMFLPGAFGSSHNITYVGSGVPPAESVERVVGAVEEALTELRPVDTTVVHVLKRPFLYHLREVDEEKQAAEVKYVAETYFPESAQSNIDAFAEMRAQMAPLAGQERQTWLQVIRLGDVAFVGVPGEFYARLGLRLRRQSPFRWTYVIGLANNSLGYIPDRQAYTDSGYQTWVGWHSRMAVGTGEALIEQALGMLGEVQGE